MLYEVITKTHSYHWNVTGPMFTTLHTLFETHYMELALAVDEIARLPITTSDDGKCVAKFDRNNFV